MTKSGIVGTFGGLNIPTVTIFMEGFRQGVKQYNTTTAPTSSCSAGTAKDGSFTERLRGQDQGSDGRRAADRPGRRHPVPGRRSGRSRWPAGRQGRGCQGDLGRHRRLRLDRVRRHPADLGDEGPGHLGDRGDQGGDRRHLHQRALPRHAGQRRRRRSRRTTTSTARSPRSSRTRSTSSSKASSTERSRCRPRPADADISHAARHEATSRGGEFPRPGSGLRVPCRRRNVTVVEEQR